MTKSERQLWEQKRAMGRDRFLLHAIIRFGLLFGVLMTASQILLPYFKHQAVPSVAEIFVKFCFYTMSFGAFMGWHTWNSNEADYNKPAEEDDA